MSELREFFESEYPGKQVLFEHLIKPIFAKAKDTTLTDEQVLSDADKKQIKSFSIIAQVRGGFPVTFADVELQDTVALKRSRVNIQSCVRKIMANDSNAVIFFHFTDSKKEWRVSYVHRSDTNKNTTNAKRYTYLCGPEHSCRTIGERFETLKGLSTIKDNDLINAFSVEPLSREFFEKYREFYADLVEYISGTRYIKKGGKFVEEKTKKANGAYKDAFGGNDKLVRDYVKKMMGRLVFLHFLQKKGWLAVLKGSEWGTGDKNFFYNLFNNAGEQVKNDFLEQALEPLFFATLNTDRGKEAVAPKALCDIYGKEIRIPYLNGGLFEEDELDKKKVKFKKDHFASLFKFFNQYNFTIDETDPDDTEIGVDPEMLGKIFENLLEDNKDKGAFYTPKEIVQYMCRESLIAYLAETKIEETKIRSFVLNQEVSDLTEKEKAELLHALLEVKVCDPAVGSGAFPMGMLNELFACTRSLTGDAKSNVELKQHIVKNNIYGVDIEKGAVDIARLRFWLAIVVDETEPKPLPNLDYKIMQGNSLLESFEGVDLSCLTKKHEYENKQQDLFGGEDTTIESLTKAIDGFFIPSNHIAKAKIRNQISENLIQLLKERQIPPKVINDLKKLDLHENNQFFLWHTWFSDVFNRPNGCNGFDIVIGNPPYIKEYTNKAAFDGFRENSPYYMGKMDLWYGFACHGLDLLRGNGLLCFIAQNNWTTSSGAKLMRKKVITDSKIKQMLDFNTYMVFENADIQTMVMLFERNNIVDNYYFDYRTLLAPSQKEDMLSLLEKQKTANTKYLTPKIKRNVYADKLLTFSENYSIFEKIVTGKSYLQDDEVAQGIVPNPDVVNSRNIKNITNDEIVVGEGVFVIDKDKFAKLNEKEKKYIKPLYEPYQMSRYFLNSKNEKCILYITKANWKNDAPTLKKHLERYKEIMEARRENINGRISFYHLHWPREEKFFTTGEKILSVRKCDKPTFVYYEPEAYVMMAVNVIQTSRWNIKFLTGVLNSKLVAFWLRHKGKMQGENYQVDKEPLLGIPLPEPTSINHDIEQEIVRLVDEILGKKANQEDTKNLEAQIDSKVYELYGLTEDEIKIIENKS